MIHVFIFLSSFFHISLYLSHFKFFISFSSFPTVLSSFDNRLSSISSSSSSSHLLPDPPTFPRLAPQCKGVAPSPSSHFNTGPHHRLLNSESHSYHLRPCPFTLSISPSLTQRSLYAQKILSSSSSSPNPTPTHSKLFRPFTKSSLSSTTSSSFLHYATQPRFASSSQLKSAASEFSFISLSSTGTPIPAAPSTCPSDSPRLSSQSPSHHSFDSDSPPPPPPVPPPRILTVDRRMRPVSSYYIEANSANSYSSSSSSTGGASSFTLPQKLHHHGRIGVGGGGGGYIQPSSPLVMNNHFANHPRNIKRKTRMTKIIENSSRNFF